MRSIHAKNSPAALVVLLAVASCGEQVQAPILAGHGDDPTPRRGGTLRLASFADVRSLDPAATSDALGTEAAELIFAGLVDFDTEGNVVPDLAERFEVDDDGRTYRFFLRPGVRFHDGSEVTANDVTRSIERALHPTTPNPFSSFYEPIVGYRNYTEKKSEHLSGVVVEGRYVVSIHLNEPDATFLPILALQPLRPVCPTGGSRYSDDWLPCGAGPFRLNPGGWDRGRSLTLVRFDGYFLPDLPHLDAVTWTYGMNMVPQRFKFGDGDLDVLRDFLQPDLIRFLADPRWKPYLGFEPEREINAEAMNTEMPPFDNVEVRRAVAAAVDRSHMQAVRSSSLRALTQAVPPGTPGHNPNFRGQEYDYAKALEHMAKAGFPYDPKTGKGGYPTVIPYPTYKQGIYEYTGQILQQDLAKIGIRIELRILNYPSWLAVTQRRGKTALSPVAWKQDYPDAMDFLDPLFGTSAINDEGSNNPAFFSSPTLDAILGRARRELDPRKRYALYDQANRLVCDEAPWAFTSSVRRYDAWQPYVKGFQLHPVWTLYAKGVWLDRGGEQKTASRAGLHGGAPASILGVTGR